MSVSGRKNWIRITGYCVAINAAAALLKDKNHIVHCPEMTA